jgi:predicted nucleic acid-binding protein
MASLPLLVFDTNILMEVLLGRDGADAVLLVELAEKSRVELVVPEYVLLEFRGTALRWTREQLDRLTVIRHASNEWARSKELDTPAASIKMAAADVETSLAHVRGQIDTVITRFARSPESNRIHPTCTFGATCAI